MKNVAKCDTWCELQNPVNHRVFERKLRPRPLGRGHACLGVTPKHASNSIIGDRNAAYVPRLARDGELKIGCLRCPRWPSSPRPVTARRKACPLGHCATMACGLPIQPVLKHGPRSL